MKLKTRLLICALIFTVLLTALSACGDKNGDTVEETAGSSETAGETGEETGGKTLYSADYLPEADYGGYKFRVINVDEDKEVLRTGVVTESANGEVFNDARYTRNSIIEEKYNITFEQRAVSSWADLSGAFKKSVNAGSDDFDLCMLISREAFSIALEGKIVPVSELKYVDISRPWYATKVNESITIGGKLYFAYSDECLNMFEQSLLVAFNKTLTANLGIENIYSLVDSGKWTLDKLFELAKTAVSDTDGDGQMTDADRYGILSEADMFYPCVWVSSDIKTVVKDENDMPVFNGLNNEKLFEALNKTYDQVFGGDKILFNTTGEKITSYKDYGDIRDVTRRMFKENKGLFYVNCVGALQVLRDMESDFGIVPFPKYDEAQREYVTRVIDGWINVVPVTAPDLERTGVIMEALAVESGNYTIPAYYEIALKNKYSRDEDSARMLDIIYGTRTMDMGDTFWMDNIRNIYVRQIEQGKNEFVSASEKAEGLVEKILDRAITAFEKIN